MKQIMRGAIASVICAGALATAIPADAAVRHLYIAATDGWQNLPDHNGYPPDAPPTVASPYRLTYMRGFCDDSPITPDAAAPGGYVGSAQPGCANSPAPIIDVVQGDDVFIHLRNVGNANAKTPVDPHTIHLHGMHVTTQNDGFNETSWEVPDPADAAANGTSNVGTYYFQAAKPGTYMWHCHVEASEHITMGMFGALVIRPSVGTDNTVYGGSFNDTFDKEYIMLLSDIDVDGRDFIETGAKGGGTAAYNFAHHQPEWWTVNGRSFPDVLMPLFDPTACNANPGPTGCNPAATGPTSDVVDGSYIPAGGPLTYAATVDAAYGERVLMRTINMGYSDQSWHLHGAHFRSVGVDANPILPENQKEAYTLHIGSGKTHDLIVTMNDVSCLGATTTAAAESLVTGQGDGANLWGASWSAATGLQIVPGDNVMNEQWYPMHTHYDYQVTNNGLYPGGMAAMIRISGTPECGI